MIGAAIDIGTNSILLLVAEKGTGMQLRVLEEAERITRLGRGMERTGVLEASAIRETAEAVQELVEMAKRRGAERVLLAATSAARDALNGQELVWHVERTTGLTLRILSGIEEAEGTFLGVASDPALAQQVLRVVDSGGGSTEIIRGRAARIVALTSITVGHVRLSERFLSSDPPSDAQVARLVEYVRTEVRKAEVTRKEPAEILVGVGGTVTTLAAVDLRLAGYDAQRIDGHVLSVERVQALRRKLQALPLAARARVAGLHPRRAPVIVAGAAVFEAIMAELGFAELRVTTRGLRHGLLLSEMSQGRRAE